MTDLTYEQEFSLFLLNSKSVSLCLRANRYSIGVKTGKLRPHILYKICETCFRALHKCFHEMNKLPSFVGGHENTFSILHWQWNAMKWNSSMYIYTSNSCHNITAPTTIAPATTCIITNEFTMQKVILLFTSCISSQLILRMYNATVDEDENGDNGYRLLTAEAQAATHILYWI